MELIIVIFLVWILSVSSIYLGIYIGSKNEPLKLPRIIKKKTKVGAIPKLSPSEIEMKGTKREETVKAMEETLDKIL